MPSAADASAVSRTAQRLAAGYYAFLVAHLVAVNPQSINSLPPAKVLGEDPTGVAFEILPTLTGPVLFDFIGPADVIDLLQSVEVHLSALARASAGP